MSHEPLSRRDFVKATATSAIAAGLGLGQGAIRAATTSGMAYRRLGRTGIMVSELGLGCSPVGQRQKFAEYCETMPKVIRRALDLGINVLDTGPEYHTQPLLGRTLGDVKRDSVIICTKSEQTRRDRIIAELENSLRELRTEYVDVLHEHDHYRSIEPATGRLEFVDACESLKEQGKIRFFGLAGHNPDVLSEYARTGHFDTVMVPYNYLTRRPEQDLLRVAQRMDLGVFAIKPLTGYYRVWDLPSGSDARLDALAKKYQASDYVQAGIKFVLSNTLLSCAVCGMERVFEVEANVATAGKLMTRRDRDIMDSYTALAGGLYCRLCEACMPCPQGVAIPDVQRFHMYYENYGHTDRGRELYAQLPARERADRCVACGQCEERCPHGLPVREKLRAAHRALA